jgi:hypothetical protein
MGQEWMVLSAWKHGYWTSDNVILGPRQGLWNFIPDAAPQAASSRFLNSGTDSLATIKGHSLGTSLFLMCQDAMRWRPRENPPVHVVLSMQMQAADERFVPLDPVCNVAPLHSLVWSTHAALGRARTAGVAETLGGASRLSSQLGKSTLVDE